MGLLLATAWTVPGTHCLYCCLLSNCSPFLPKAPFSEICKQIRIKDTPHSVINPMGTLKGAKSASEKL